MKIDFSAAPKGGNDVLRGDPERSKEISAIDQAEG
jgi:hypothetical protein